MELDFEVTMLVFARSSGFGYSGSYLEAVLDDGGVVRVADVLDLVPVADAACVFSENFVSLRAGSFAKTTLISYFFPS